jgi:WD40 repeat protein
MSRRHRRVDLPASIWIHNISRFLARGDWNKVGCLNREFHEESLTATPPWPERHFRFEASPYACSLAFDPTGQWLALASGTLSLWHVRLGRCFQGQNTISVHPLVHVQFASTYILSATYHTIRFWELPTIENSALINHEELESLSTYPHVILSLTILTKNENHIMIGHLATPAAPPRVASIWNISTGQCLQVFGEHMHPIPNAYSVLDCPRFDINLSPHDTSSFVPSTTTTSRYHALIGDSTGRIHVWNYEDDVEQNSFDDITSSESSWKAHENKLQHIELVSDTVLATCSLAASSGTMARTVEKKATVKLWDLRAYPPECIGTSSPKMRALNMGVMDMSVSNNTIAFGDATGTLNIWDIDEIVKAQHSKEGHRSSQPSSPRRISNMRQRALLKTLQGNHGSSPIKAVQFSPDGQAIASACSDGTLQLWLKPSLTKKKPRSSIILDPECD